MYALPYGVEEAGPKQLRFDNTGGFLTVLLFGGATAMIGGALIIIALGGLQGVLGAVMPVAMGSLFLVLGSRRRRSMGQFLIDAEKRVVLREAPRAETWSFDQVRVIETVMDPFARTPMAITHGQPRWVIARLTNGQSLRLCKGFREDLAPFLGHLRELGLTVER